MRLYKRILKNGSIVPLSLVNELPQLDHAITSSIESAVQVSIDNVFEHLVGLSDAGRNGLMLTNLPSSMPPWPTMFVEWRYSHRAIQNWIPWQNVIDGQAGWFVDTFSNDDGTAMVQGSMFLYGNYEEDAGIPHGPMCFIQINLDQEGHIIPNTLVGRFFNDAWPGLFREALDSKSKNFTQFLMRQVWMPVAFAIGLTHCKNVSIEERLPPRQQRRQSERKGDPILKYHEIVIDPTKTHQPSTGAKRHDDKPSKALHIARGHFAHYTEDRPLFGKYTGTFWRPAHVRGSADIGTVYKDYKVKAA